MTARSLQRIYHIDGDAFERAYKNYLSGFRQWTEADHACDWLVFPHNMGPSLSIDETSLSDGELYTLVSNKAAHGRKGSLVAIVKGTRVNDVVRALNRIMWSLRAKVMEVTMDLSESMRSIVWQCFPNAMVTLDRFHVQKDCYDAMQAIRVKHRREARLQEIEDREQHRHRRKQNASRRKQGKKDPRGRKPQRANVKYEPRRLSNGDTKCELLARSRYLLSVSADKWTESQRQRAKLLFSLYPDIKQAYSICHSLRCLFSDKALTKQTAKERLKQWYNKVTDFDDPNFNTVSATIYQRQDEILNYFVNRQTNASAESLNAKIKYFRGQLHGVVDVEFFLYRLSLIYA